MGANICKSVSGISCFQLSRILYAAAADDAPSLHKTALFCKCAMTHCTAVQIPQDERDQFN